MQNGTEHWESTYKSSAKRDNSIIKPHRAEWTYNKPAYQVDW